MSSALRSCSCSSKQFMCWASHWKSASGESIIPANTSLCQRGGIEVHIQNAAHGWMQTDSGQERGEETRPRQQSWSMISFGEVENSDMSDTGKEPAADGEWVQGRGGGQRDETSGPLPMITWSCWPCSERAPQLAAELADRRPIIHLAKQWVKQGNQWKQVLGVTVVGVLLWMRLGSCNQ